MDVQTYSNVWDAVADSPAEAGSLRLRSHAMDALEDYILREGITQRVAAERLGVPRSRIIELVNGRLSKFTINELRRMTGRVGLSVTTAVEDAATPSAIRRPDCETEGWIVDPALAIGLS